MQKLQNQTHITLPRHIYVNGDVCRVLSYDEKRHEASLSDGSFIAPTWPMEPDQWRREKAAWIARGASEGAVLFFEAHSKAGLGWHMTA